MPPTENIQYAPPGSYLAYKRNGRLLLRWIVRTVHAIIKSRDVAHQHDLDWRMLKPVDGLPGQNFPKASYSHLSRTGYFNRIRLYNFCNFISKHLDTLPTEIVALFMNIIDARVIAYTTWQALTVRRPGDADMNDCFGFGCDLDSFWSAFNTLRGFDNMQNVCADLGAFSKHSLPESEEDVDRLVPGMLSIHHRFSTSSASKTRGSRSGFDKIRATLPPEDLPLSCYDIDDPVYADDRYSANGNTWGMEAYDLFKEFARLRVFLQDTWEETVIDGINSAIAARIGYTAMSLINKYHDDMNPEGIRYIDLIGYFTDYQGPGSYVQPFDVSLFGVDADGALSRAEHRTVDMGELLLIHTFESLVEFFSDFHVKKNGKPTESMEKVLQKWDPTVDLGDFTEKEFLEWRHIYTIKLLWSLFYKYGYRDFVEQRVAEVTGEPVASEGGNKHHPHNSVSDWYETLWSTLASVPMKEPLTGYMIRRSIKATTVFTLQLVVDSFTVSRGCTHDPLRGLDIPKASSVDTFFPARDLQSLFTADGNLGLSDAFVSVCVWGSDLQVRPGQLEKVGPMLRLKKTAKEGRKEVSFLQDAAQAYSFAQKFQSGEQQHRAVSAAFLWGFSPFECGLVLAQALGNAAYINHSLDCGFSKEPVLLVHLHNMLVLEGYLKEPAHHYLELRKYFNSLVVNAAKTPEHGQAGAQYDRVLRMALECLSEGVPQSAFGRLWDGKHGVGSNGHLQSLQRFLENPSTTIGEIQRGPQVREKGCKKDLEYTIRSGRGRAQIIMKGLQDVGYDYKKLMPGKVLVGPDGDKVMVNFLDILELLKAEFIIDTRHHVQPTLQIEITQGAVTVFESIERELAALRDPLYLEIYGDPDLMKQNEDSKKDETPKDGDDESSLNTGKQKNPNPTLVAKRTRLVERLLTRSLEPPGIKTAIGVAVKALKDERISYMSKLQGRDNENDDLKKTRSGEQVIMDNLWRGLEPASQGLPCPVM